MSIMERIALDHLDQMTDSTADPACDLWHSAARKRLHDRRQRTGPAALRTAVESAPRGADAQASDHLSELS